MIQDHFHGEMTPTIIWQTIIEMLGMRHLSRVILQIVLVYMIYAEMYLNGAMIGMIATIINILSMKILWGH